MGPAKGVNQETEITLRKRLADAKRFRFTLRTSVGSENNVHQRRDVGVVSRLAIAAVMPMMQFGGADQQAQRSDGQANVGMYVDGPDAAKSQQSSKRFQWKTKQEGGQIYQSHSIDGVERMLAMGCEPIEMFGAVVNRMKAP